MLTECESVCVFVLLCLGSSQSAKAPDVLKLDDVFNSSFQPKHFQGSWIGDWKYSGYTVEPLSKGHPIFVVQSLVRKRGPQIVRDYLYCVLFSENEVSTNIWGLE